MGIKEKAYGSRHIQVASVLAKMGAAHGVLKDTEQQVSFLQRALDILERDGASGHADLVRKALRQAHETCGTATAASASRTWQSKPIAMPFDDLPDMQGSAGPSP